MRIATALLLVGLAVSGSACAGSDFWKHDTMYASGDHLLFSARNAGRKPTPRVTQKDIKEAEAQSWWGRPVVFDPDQVRR